MKPFQQVFWLAVLGLAIVSFASGCVTSATVGYAAGHGCDLPGGARVKEADKIPHPTVWPLVPLAAVVDVVLTPIYIPLGVQWIGWWIEEQKPWTPEEVGGVAWKLANEKAQTLFNCQPFPDRPAQFVQGHWTWHCEQAQGQGDFEATVEFDAKFLKLWLSTTNLPEATAEFEPKSAKPRVTVLRLDSRSSPKLPPP